MVYICDNNILNKISVVPRIMTYMKDGQACISSNFNVNTSTINGSKTTNEKWFLESDTHVPLECDPNFASNHGDTISQCPWFGAYRVVITRVCDLVAHEASSGVATAHLPRKTYRAGCELRPVAPPARVPSPATVNGVQAKAAETLA